MRKPCLPGKWRSQGYIRHPPNTFMPFHADFVCQKHVPGSIETNYGSLSKIIGESCAVFVLIGSYFLSISTQCWCQFLYEEEHLKIKRIWPVCTKITNNKSIDASLVRTKRRSASWQRHWLSKCVCQTKTSCHQWCSQPPTRTRTRSTPGHGKMPSSTPASAGPYRTSFPPRGFVSPLRSRFDIMNGHSMVDIYSLFACFSISTLNIVSGSS